MFFLSLDLLGRSGSGGVDPPSSFSALSELVLLFVFYLLSVPCLVSGGVIVSQ
uniref:Uncharacterized protein n=1 Tax=Brassica campestris TaxID=3711 RepID=M4E4P3_BRACM